MKRIPATWLNSYAYCEYQIYLEHCRGATPEPKAETEEGKAAQASLEEAYKAAAKHELSVDYHLTYFLAPCIDFPILTCN